VAFRIVERRVQMFSALTPDEQQRLETIALDLIADKDWEAAHGFELTDDIVVTIAAQAALLVLELPADSFRNVSTILVQPSAVRLERAHRTGKGMMSDDRMFIDGQAVFGGPVMIAWDAARFEARHPGRGTNVVLHEFAHKLDMLDGTLDGTPLLADQAQRERWIEVCTRVYRAVEIGEGGEALRSYAGIDAAEFFAVATEVFFDRPHMLRDEHPDLYECLRDFYRQDPSTRTVS
jgi:Mlc titration factor MtfA (ptsG expression regulator)